MIEQIIYWTGVATLMCVGLLIISASLYFAATLFVQHTVNKLQSCYRHAALYFVMRKIMKLGYTGAVNEIAEQCATVYERGDNK